MPGPSTKVASWTATSDWPSATSVPSDALDEAGRDEPDRELFAVAAEEGERQNRGADVGDDEQQLQSRPDEDAGVAAAGAKDEVGVVEQRVVQQQRPGCS
jgi:hypothetical protein